jgi:hypothetical protein
MEIDDNDALGVLREQFEKGFRPGRAGPGPPRLLSAGDEGDEDERNDDTECREFFHRDILLFEFSIETISKQGRGMQERAESRDN